MGDSDPDQFDDPRTWLATRSSAVERFLSRLVSIDTGPKSDRLREAAEVVAVELQSLGFEALVLEGVTPIVLAWFGSASSEPSLLLTAHLDTSDAGKGWSFDPYRLTSQENRLFGRGVALSKGSVAAYCYALGAARAVRRNPESSVLLAVTADEGTGGHSGVRRVLMDLGIRPHRAVTPGVADAVIVAHDGVVQVKVTIEGWRGHSALVDGANSASHAAALVGLRIIKYDATLRRRRSTIEGIGSPTVLTVTADFLGGGFSVAPGVVELFVERRVTPDEEVGEAERELRSEIDSARVGTAIRVTTATVNVVNPLAPASSSLRFATTIGGELSLVTGYQPAYIGWPLYTDARWFGDAGVPTVLYGAGSRDLALSSLNGPDESIHRENLHNACLVLARVCLSAGGPPSKSRSL